MATLLINDASYACPHCRHLLEIPNTPWRGWLLCPECGLPGLPPERLTFLQPGKRTAARQPEVPQDLVAEAPGTSKESATMIKPSVPRSEHLASSSAPRLIVPTGFLVSAFLLLVAYLDRSSHSMAIFGSLTVIFFILFLRIQRRR